MIAKIKRTKIKRTKSYYFDVEHVTCMELEVFVASTSIKIFGMQWSEKSWFVRGTPITSRIDMLELYKKENSARLIFTHKATRENILTAKITQTTVL